MLAELNMLFTNARRQGGVVLIALAGGCSCCTVPSNVLRETPRLQERDRKPCARLRSHLGSSLAELRKSFLSFGFAQFLNERPLCNKWRRQGL